MSEATMEMPKYDCTKQVWALKISKAKVTDSDGGGFLEFEDSRFARREMDARYMNKHEPKAGGYFVMYKGGYESFSPADAFESGYSLI